MIECYKIKVLTFNKTICISYSYLINYYTVNTFILYNKIKFPYIFDISLYVQCILYMYNSMISSKIRLIKYVILKSDFEK